MGKNVMLVDDDPFFQKMLTDILKREGYTVTVAGSWIDFTKAYFGMAVRPDLILFDINLGGAMTGDRLLSTYKKESKVHTGAKQTKLVLISSDPNDEIAAKARVAGADGYIHKESIHQQGTSNFVYRVRSFLSQGG